MRAHLGLAITIAHIWNGTLKRSSPPKKPAVVVDESDIDSEGDGESDVSSLPMMNDEQGIPVDLGQMNVKDDIKAQQKVLAYLTSKPQARQLGGDFIILIHRQFLARPGTVNIPGK